MGNSGLGRSRVGGWFLVLGLVIGLLALAASAAGTFSDDDGNVHEGNIEAIAAEGITRGCNPPVNDLYCPSDPVTRGQMAAFLVRAMGYTDDGGGDRFIDDDDSVFEADIDKLATAGVTLGCNPPANTRFCPTELVLRDQMASFLARALDLQPIVPSTTSTTTTTSTTEPGELAPPQSLGPIDADGKAEVTISNNAPYALTVEFDGPEDRTLQIDACEDCIEYVVPPIFCPEKGPEVVALLAPGTYEVVVRADDPDIGAFAGTWNLDGDWAYFSCFIIVISYG